MTDLPLFAIVPAAGVGSRMGADMPKQYLPLVDQTVIEHTLSKLLQVSAVQKIIVCLAAEDQIFHSLPCAKSERIITVEGGVTRGESVCNGLHWLVANGFEHAWALVHDAARPCVNPKRIEQLVHECAVQNTGGILAIPMANTLRRVDDQKFGKTETVSRENMWAAHTPQLFRVNELLNGLAIASASATSITDEASAIEAAGGGVLIIEDESCNIKVTRPEDMLLASVILNAQLQEIL